MARRHDFAAWTPELDARLRDLAAAGTPPQQIAAEMGRTYASVTLHLVKLGLTTGGGSRPSWSDAETRAAVSLDWPDYHARYPERSHQGYVNKRREYRASLAVPSVTLTDYTRTVARVEGDALVAACVHVPETDLTMWARLLSVGARDKLPRLIVAGDLVTLDMFSKWLALGQIPEWGFDDEMESLHKLLRSALDVFDEIVVTPGNHISRRIVRVTGGHIKLKQLMDMAGLADADRARIATTEQDFLDLRSGGERFLVGHASNYRQRGGQIAREYAEKYESHVIVGNGHITGHQISRSGRWHGYELPTLLDPRVVRYAHESLTLFPQWQQGFATVRDGVVRLYGSGKPMTDWAAEMG